MTSSAAPVPGIGTLLRCFALAALLWTGAAPGRITIDAIPGGVVEIPLAPTSQGRPDAYFGQHRTLVTDFGSRWVSLVGLPLDIVPGTYVMQTRLNGSGDLVTRKFTVYPRRINRQPVVRLPEMAFDTPAIEFSWREPLDADLPLGKPVAASAEPVFGRFRQISETRSGYVDFVTFRVASDTSIAAPGNGRIAAVETTEAGAYVWIDHGMGLYTCVGPATRAVVQPSDAVAAGQAVGRVVLDEDNEPVSLYWSVYLNGTAVNPFLVSDIELESTGGTRRRNGSG